MTYPIPIPSSELETATTYDSYTYSCISLSCSNPIDLNVPISLDYSYTLDAIDELKERKLSANVKQIIILNTFYRISFILTACPLFLDSNFN